MTAPIRKVAILGSGVMGGAIAAHFANAGVPSLVLDIVPAAPTDAETAAGLTLQDRAVRDRLAVASIKALAKTKPAPLFSAARAAMIEVGNFDDDMPRLAEADWVIEVVKEDPAIKAKVLAAAAPHLSDHAWLSSNTSGLSLATMAQSLPAALRPRFLGTHFFNPPRYMKLLELIPTADTDPATLAAVADFAALRLGKGVVHAKDTPNFVANRIGVHGMMATVAVMAELGLTVEEIDALTGPAIGRPKTATFQLADLVGLDTFLHVAANVHASTPDDESRELFAAPDFLTKMVEKGLLGRKSGGGFYKMMKEGGKKEILTLDLDSLEYREKRKAKFPELEALREKPLPERLRALVLGKGRTAEALWKLTAPSLLYAARRLGEICDDASAVDRAMRWGFNWKLGPFETWDALGFRAVCERFTAEGETLPDWVRALYDAGDENLYVEDDAGALQAPTASGARAPVPPEPGVHDFEHLRRAGREVKRNPGASLLDLGDGVLCLEFHAKMNVIGQDTLQMIMAACDLAERDWRALVVANQGSNFSAGANLMMLLMAAAEGEWEDIDLVVRAFQRATDRLEFCGVPVVVAPHGLALGGGCEMTMAGDAVQAAAESYVGLVEVGAGLVPAGGGCARLYRRLVAREGSGDNVYTALKTAFQTIGMAKVATSAEEARDLGFLRPGDGWSMHGERRVADAKSRALALADVGYAPPLPPRDVPVLGRGGLALLESALFNMEEAGWISPHDALIGRRLAAILSGGDIPGPTTASHVRLLELEREHFLKLCGERKTLERMQHILKTGKPLRN